ncbi:hypothetical protein AVEN_105812-1 [Araneus ventricosus]|uniref:Uncharacterized protein n=1 Tax=Araneus ventricosus TaxID=182803 RepID=A0A4Y2R1X4_ARAVE|nr:hypothetical protein AVEN_105812-1 [Araneus ventricosus]
MPTPYEKEMERLPKLLAEVEIDEDLDFDNEDNAPEDVLEENISDHESFSLPTAGVMRKFGEWCHPAQVSSSSSDRSSIFRSVCQNSPCVALKRDVNITKLN